MRHPAKLLITGAALLVAASCNNEATVAPGRSAVPSIAGSPALAALVTPTSYDFVIPAAGGQVNVLGMYTLTVPANAVCDPNAQNSRDGYTAAAWDSPCTPLTTDLTMHATLQWVHNRLWVDFSPSLRFVPSANVTIATSLMAPIVKYYSDAQGNDLSAGRSSTWGIFFASAIGAYPVDDAVADPSIRTNINFFTGVISRRIKHFTGYSITTGAECTVGPDDPYCVDDGSGNQ